VVDSAAETQGRAWSLEAVQQLRELAEQGLSAGMVSMKLKRSEADVRAKAAALGLHLKTGL
jgi:hypothetical protein